MAGVIPREVVCFDGDGDHDLEIVNFNVIAKSFLEISVELGGVNFNTVLISIELAPSTNATENVFKTKKENLK